MCRQAGRLLLGHETGRMRRDTSNTRHAEEQPQCIPLRLVLYYASAAPHSRMPSPLSLAARCIPAACFTLERSASDRMHTYLCEVGALCQLLDGIPSVSQDAFVAVNV